MSTDSAPERYRRRHRWPILVFLLVMLLGTGIIWFQILKPGPVAATGCNNPGPAPTSATPTTRTTLSSTAGAVPPSSTGRSRATGSPSTAPRTGNTPARPTRSTTRSTAGSTKAGTTRAAPVTSGSNPTITTTLGVFVAANSLANTRPADPSNVVLQVYNASKTRGQARTLTKDLQVSGFDSIRAATNDVLYPASDLICQAEIRFGQAGLSQARTVLIIAPCAQLVRDDRFDESVDLALGARYDYAPLTDAVKKQLKALHDAAAPPAVIEGQTASARPLASIPPLPTADCTGTTTTSR